MKLTPPPALRLCALLFLLLLALTPGFAAETLAPAPDVPKGVRLFTCAHSFHSFVYGLLAEIAKKTGIKDQVPVGMSAIGGSRVQQHWDVTDDKNLAKAALRDAKVDVLTLAPIWMPDEGIDHFAQLGFERNPEIRVTVQEFWLPNDTYEPRYPLETRKQVDHNATDLAELKKNQDQYDHDVDEYVAGINRRLGHQVIFTVPVGQAVLALREKVAAGQAPGLEKQWDLFRDMWGHPQAPIQVLNAYCHYAVIYRRSPVGLPMVTRLQDAKHPGWNESLNRLLQELAWDAVTHHPMSGVAADSK